MSLGHRKRERRELEVARVASIAYGKSYQLRAIQSIAGASSSRVVEVEKSTNDGVVIVGGGTTEGVANVKATT